MKLHMNSFAPAVRKQIPSRFDDIKHGCVDGTVSQELRDWVKQICESTLLVLYKTGSDAAITNTHLYRSLFALVLVL